MKTIASFTPTSEQAAALRRHARTFTDLTPNQLGWVLWQMMPDRDAWLRSMGCNRRAGRVLARAARLVLSTV